MYNINDIPLDQLQNVAQEIISNTDIGEEDCWWWTGKADANGYGRIRVPIVAAPGYEWVLTHRLTFMIKYGTLPRGTFIHKTCENPLCCNPEHMVI